MSSTTGYRDYVEKVRTAHSVEDLFRERYGRPAENHYALCPFHSDSRPSCSVNERFFHCFSCKAGGDAFHLLQRLDGLSFTKAVDTLAELAGIPPFHPIASDRAAVVSERALDDVTELVCSYYEHQMTTEARTYLTEFRRLPAALVDQQRCGWADGAMVAHVAPLASVDLLVQAGLAVEQKNAATWTGAPAARDWLRDRVTFPVLQQGRARFLSGRTLQADVTPKYLHQRGRPAPLYNPDVLGQDEVIAVEGQVDALSLLAWQLPTVGLLGTMHTSVVHALRRPKRLYVCLDPDPAGQTGAYKVAAAVGVDRVRLVPLPDGLDPNDFYRTHPKAAFLRLLRSAQEPVAYALSRVPYLRVDPDQLDKLLAPVFLLWQTVSAAAVQSYLDHTVTAWAQGNKPLVKAVADTWAQQQKRRVQCPACGTYLHHPA